LKELQVVSEALRKGDNGLGFFLSFPKGWGSLGEEGMMGYFHPFPKEVFFKGLGKVNFFGDED
jgi:hypothetical protein